MLFVVSGSILAWPLGDLYFGPTLASVAARSSTAPNVETDAERRAAKALGEGATTLRVWRVVLAICSPEDRAAAVSPAFIVDYAVEALAAQI